MGKKQWSGVSFREAASLKHDPNNARLHSPEQIEDVLSSILTYGWTMPLLVDDVVRAGNARLEAALLAYERGHTLYMVPGPDAGGTAIGAGLVPCVDCTGWSKEKRVAYGLADNKLALNATWDEAQLREQLAMLNDMGAGADALITGFDEDETLKLLAITGSDTAEPGSLASDFGAPPFSIFDTRQGYWQERRANWEKLTGNLSETKEGVLSGSTMLATINEGSSNFDPVLAELCMRWFCPAGGWVLDPFGGEQTKGVVAGTLGLNYRATEIREDQVRVNEAACASFDTVGYRCCSAEDIDEFVTERDFNFCFTSPPYYDLEVYSADDMSALGTYEEFMAMYERIFAKCVDMLAENAFLAVKIGEIRDKKTGVFRNFVGDNITIFKRLGLAYYNEATIISPPGTAPQRARRYMSSRKLAKLHQNLLVFAKGDPVAAAEACGPVVAMDFQGDE